MNFSLSQAKLFPEKNNKYPKYTSFQWSIQAEADNIFFRPGVSDRGSAKPWGVGGSGRLEGPDPDPGLRPFRRSGHLHGDDDASQPSVLPTHHRLISLVPLRLVQLFQQAGQQRQQQLEAQPRRRWLDLLRRGCRRRHVQRREQQQ